MPLSLNERDKFPYIILFILPGPTLLTPGLGAENYFNVILKGKTITPCSQNLRHQVTGALIYLNNEQYCRVLPKGSSTILECF
jgi:hypothetical protein